MNLKEIQEIGRKFTSNVEVIILETYFLLKKEDKNVLKLLNLREDVQEKLKKEFFQVFQEKVLGNNELSLQSITDATDESNTILHYNLDEKPKDLSIINELLLKDDWENFDFKDDDLSEVIGIVYLVQNEDDTLISYKKTYPIHFLRKDSKGIKIFKPKGTEKFVEVDDDIYSIYPEIDFFQLNNDLYILDLKVLEKFFGFHDVLLSTARDTIDKIDGIDILVDTIVLQTIISEMTQARKLTQVGNHSPVVGKIANEDIINFIDNHPGLTGKFKFNEDKTKIQLDTKISAKLFIKLLNDDFLLSELTSFQYDTRAKSKLEDNKV